MYEPDTVKKSGDTSGLPIAFTRRLVPATICTDLGYRFVGQAPGVFARQESGPFPERFDDLGYLDAFANAGDAGQI